MAQISKKAKGKEKYFPPEFFFEIVSRLPSKCVGRFTTVSKSWYAFIKSAAFIAAHLKESIAHNKVDDSSHFLLFMSPTSMDYLYCSAYRDKTESFDKVFNLKLPMDFKWGNCRPIGSCNGLVCLSDENLHGRVIYFWNPVMRKYKSITGTSCCRTMFYRKHTLVTVEFWYDDRKHDYKLIRIMHNKRDNSSELYSLNVGSWRKIDAKLPGRIGSPNFHNQAFLNGTFNWIAYDNAREFILSFDTSTEQFRKVEVPKYIEYREGLGWSAYLGVHKGCLALFVGLDGRTHHDDWSVWVMKEFGVLESWVKKYTLVTKEAIRRPIGVTQKDEIVFCCEEAVIAYNLETDMIRFLPHESFVHPSWFNYTENLVFLDEENGLLESASSS